MAIQGHPLLHSASFAYSKGHPKDGIRTKLGCNRRPQLLPTEHLYLDQPPPPGSVPKGHPLPADPTSGNSHLFSVPSMSIISWSIFSCSTTFNFWEKGVGDKGDEAWKGRGHCLHLCPPAHNLQNCVTRQGQSLVHIVFSQKEWKTALYFPQPSEVIAQGHIRQQAGGTATSTPVSAWNHKAHGLLPPREAL